MAQQALILNKMYFDFTLGYFGHILLKQSVFSANGWDCFCKFCIIFFTHFIALWDEILFDGPLEIKESAQLRKLVNFLRETQINQAPSDLTLADFEVQGYSRLKYQNKKVIKIIYCANSTL